MDVSLLVKALLNLLWWVLPVALVAVVFRTPWFKGVVGETIVKLAARVRLPRDTYHAIHNVTLMTEDGTTQIDHIFVSPYGIFVVETKNMKGWIFGGEFQSEWTQKIFNKSFKFQNPLRQNYKHIKALEEALDIPSSAIHSVIVFAGESVFKTPMPANVLRGGSYASYIKSFQHRVLLESEVREAVARIESGRLHPSFKTNRQHVQQLQSRKSDHTDKRCHRCSSAMVLRASTQGTRGPFWGCSTYPRCKATQKVTSG